MLTDSVVHEGNAELILATAENIKKFYKHNKLAKTYFRSFYSFALEENG